MSYWFDHLLPEDGDWTMYAVRFDPWPCTVVFEDRSGKHMPHRLATEGKEFMVPATIH